MYVLIHRYVYTVPFEPQEPTRDDVNRSLCFNVCYQIVNLRFGNCYQIVNLRFGNCYQIVTYQLLSENHHKGFAEENNKTKRNNN